MSRQIFHERGEAKEGLGGPRRYAERDQNIPLNLEAKKNHRMTPNIGSGRGVVLTSGGVDLTAMRVPYACAAYDTL